MAVRLTITDAADPTSEHSRSFVQDRIVFGRAKSTDVCLPDMAVSMRHAEIRLDGHEYVLVDLGSLNGTHLNTKELISHRPRKLNNEDKITIAGFEIHLRLGVASGPAEPRDASVRQASEMLSRILARAGRAQERFDLVLLEGPLQPSRLTLPSAPSTLTIGRGKQSDIQLEDPDISRQHARLEIDSEGLTLVDLESHNGIIVEGRKTDRLILQPGSRFVLGQTTFRIEASVTQSLNRIFEAPEEETASFIAQTEQLRPDSQPQDPDIPPDTESPDEVQQFSPPPPIGPRDPLEVNPNPMASAVPTTGNIPQQRSEDPPEGSDWGLIIVGAICVVAAVAGLIYLFG